MKKIKIIKNRSDIASPTRGAGLGIDALEIAAIRANSNYFSRYDYIDIETENDAVYDKHLAPYAKRIDKILLVCDRLSNQVKSTIQNGEFPIVLSGDHCSALGTISGVKMSNPNKRIGVVWIDAHSDIHSPYTTPSGNMHGMPLAAALAEDNMDCSIPDRQLDEETLSNWEKLKNIGDLQPKILHQDIIFFGVRDTEEEEEHLIENNGIKNYKVEEIRFRGLETCINEALAKLNECDEIYISFDVDSMDCDLISKGTGTPASKGFDQHEVKAIIDQVLDSGKVGCIEVVEIDPTLDDKRNKMAEVAFEVLDHITNKYENLK